MIQKGLTRARLDIHRASDGGKYSLRESLQGTLRRAGGGVARGPVNEFVKCEAVAYFPAGTGVRSSGGEKAPDHIWFDWVEYECVFVDRGRSSHQPVRVGLRPVEE